MENEKVKYLIEMINNMDIKDKLRLAICMSQDKWSGLIYNTKENYEKFDSMLKDIDDSQFTDEFNQCLFAYENEKWFLCAVGLGSCLEHLMYIILINYFMCIYDSFFY